MAYAHSRGVLHRDLKPANVMVGKYGETLVVDWGLAKALGRSDPDTPPDSTMLAPGSGSSSETLPGTRVGTPSYMSPEQAAGRLDLLGPASDVYGLGATLYTLLTGRLAFQGDNLLETFRKIEHGEFPRPRELSSWLDPALEAICLKAMALRPADRYPSPKALADDVERWLADGPVTAYREPWSRKVRRWRRKHRTAVTSTVAVAVLAAVLLGGYARQRADQRRRTDESALATLGQAEGLAIAARGSRNPRDWDRTIAEARIAREALDSGGGSPALRREVTARLEGFQAEKARLDEAIEADRKDRQVVADLEEARLRRAGTKDNQFDTTAMFEAYLAAFRAYGIDVGVLPVEDSAKRIRSSKVGDDLIAALDDWARLEVSKESRERLLAIARASETDPTRASIRDAVTRGDAAALRRLCERAEDQRQLGPRLRSVFNTLALLDPAGSLPLLEAIRRENPSDFWFNFNLALAYYKARQIPESVLYFKVAVALRPRSAAVRIDLGLVLEAQGDRDGAIREYRRAIELDPRYATAHERLGFALYIKGDRDGANAEYRKAIELDPKSSSPHIHLGLLLNAQGDRDGAIREYRRAIELDPKSSSPHIILGDALSAQGDRDGANAEYRKAIELDPKSSSPHISLGFFLEAQGDRDGAIREYRKAIELDPRSSSPHIHLGLLLNAQGDRDGAIREYRRAIELDPRSASPHISLGLVLEAQGDRDGAIREYRRAIELDSGNAWAHNNLGLALYNKGDRDGAIAEYRKAIDLAPKSASTHISLGFVLEAHGDRDGAIAEYRRAIEIDPKSASTHINIGNALNAHGDRDGAIAEFRTAIELDPKSSSHHINLGDALNAKGDRDGAIAEFRKAIELGPRSAPAHNWLGFVLNAKGDRDGAIAEFRTAIELDPRSAPAHANLGVVLNARGDRDGAIAEHRKAIELDPRSALYHINLGDALNAQGDRDGAIRAYRKAIDLDPRSATAHYRLGLALRSGERADEAVAELREAARLDGEKPGSAIGELGRTLLGLKRYDEAIATLREAVRLKPDDALVRYDLGAILKARGDRDGAIAEFRAAIGLKPNNASAHYFVGIALRDKGMSDEAIDEFREAVRIDGDHLGAAIWVLGDLLLNLERMDDAIALYRRARGIGDARPADIARADKEIEEAERRKALLGRLDAVLKGEVRPKDTAEALAFTGLLKARKRYDAAVRLYAEAFAADPKLAEDLGASHRYNAACYAALAGSGAGKDDPPPDESARARLREQALGWLRADLTARGKVLDGGDAKTRQALVKQLDRWKTDADLAGIRDEVALDKLPGGEREAFRTLWADVEALGSRRAGGSEPQSGCVGGLDSLGLSCKVGRDDDFSPRFGRFWPHFDPKSGRFRAFSAVSRAILDDFAVPSRCDLAPGSCPSRSRRSPRLPSRPRSRVGTRIGGFCRWSENVCSNAAWVDEYHRDG